MNTIRITGWRVGAKKIRADVYIREVSNIELAGAKKIVDTVVGEGHPAEFQVLEGVDADEAVRVLESFNFDAIRID